MCKRYSFTVSYTYVLLLVFATFLALVISPAFAGGKKGGGGSVCIVCPPSCTCYMNVVERVSVGHQLE